MKDLIVDGIVQSFAIPESNFGMSYHALLVPPFPVRTALFLGYGEGTVPALMEKIWPVGCKITGVDIRKPKLEPELFFNYQAWQFVEWAETVYDYVCIDLYKGKHIPDFVFSEKFIDGIGRITGKLLSLNITYYEWMDFEGYGKHFLPESCKRVSHAGGEDRVIFMVPKNVKN